MNIKKTTLQIMALLPLMWCSVSLHATTLEYGHTFFAQHDQLDDFARRLVGVTPQFLVPCDTDCLNGFFAVVPTYMRSFDADRYGTYFFYNGTNTMTFGTEDTAGVDVFARNFFFE